ncbi:MAG: flavin reductase family protein [candidate division WOR-3 bacterium]|nr:MAG: flavin reductase family protein [candidate division WOR-3 bacterium]
MERKTEPGKFYYFYPQAVALIGVRSNIMPAAWHTPLSADPPLYGIVISPKRYTYELLLKETGFTANFLDLEHAAIAAKTGSCSGKDIRKLDEFGIPHSPAETVNGPILDDAYAVYECERVDVREYGDHMLVVGRITLLHYRKDHAEAGQIVDEHVSKPTLYFGKDRYLTIDPKTLQILTGK